MFRTIAVAGAIVTMAMTGQLRAGAQVGGPVSRGALSRGTFAFTNVHVIPMTSDTVIRNATVVVRDGRIAAVGATDRITVPRGARVIDGVGRYVIPGLADMHTHLYSDGDVADSAAPAELGVMLANGVTAVRFMAGTPEQLRLRAAVEQGSVIGPQVWVSSPMFANRAGENTRVITSPDDARAAVREAADAGYDFIKITFGIVGEVYGAIVEEARARKIGVVGHVEPDLGLTRALEAGQQLEHLDAYFEGALADTAPMRVSLTQGGVYRQANWASLDFIDQRKLADLAQRTVRAGAWVGPTLEVFNRAFSVPLTDDQLHALPDWNMIPPAMRTLYVNSRNRYWSQPIPRERRARYAELRNAIVKHIVDAGGAARILAGSDTPDLLMVYGFALHRELQALVAAGLTPYQALAAATRNPAAYLGALGEWGTLEPGKRADFVILGANPLADIRHTERIERVVTGGRLIERAELDRMLAAGIPAVGGAAPSP